MQCLQRKSQRNLRYTTYETGNGLSSEHVRPTARAYTRAWTGYLTNCPTPPRSSHRVPVILTLSTCLYTVLTNIRAVMTSWRHVIVSWS